jgi:regulatory protein
MVNFDTSMKERRPARLEAAALWDYAVKLLGGRACSSGELREKLRRKAARMADIDPILARLKECGYLNDRQFAENFAAARLENEGLGRTRVLADLSRRRVAPAVAHQTVGKIYKDVDEEALAEDFVRRKFHLSATENLFAEEKQLAAAYRRLLRAGFRPGVAMTVLKRFARDPGLLDQIEPPEESPEE